MIEDMQVRTFSRRSRHERTKRRERYMSRNGLLEASKSDSTDSLYIENNNCLHWERRRSKPKGVRTSQFTFKRRITYPRVFLIPLLPHRQIHLPVARRISLFTVTKR